MKKYFPQMRELILKAEDLYESGKGQEKKKYVVDKLNELINIPLLPEVIEGKLIGIVIDAMVYIIFNVAKEKGVE
jgi:hypothetical protein